MYESSPMYGCGVIAGNDTPRVAAPQVSVVESLSSLQELNARLCGVLSHTLHLADNALGI